MKPGTWPACASSISFFAAPVTASTDALSEAWEVRTRQVKAEMAAASAANDAKSARLKALRLEKEREEALAPPKEKISPPKRPRVKRIVVK